MNKIMIDVLSFALALTITGCIINEDYTIDTNSSNVETRQERITQETKQEKTSQKVEERKNYNQSYVVMEVEPMSQGEKATYHVDNYVRAYGTAGASNNFYYVLNNKLYHVNAANPALSTQYATGVELVTWDDATQKVLVVTNKNFKITNQEANEDKRLVYLNTNLERELYIGSMNNSKVGKTYLADNSAVGYGWPGATNNNYFVKDKMLYYVNAANPNERKLIAIGVEYITFSGDSSFGPFVALVNNDFRYANETTQIKTININSYLEYKNNENK